MRPTTSNCSNSVPTAVQRFCLQQLVVQAPMCLAVGLWVLQANTPTVAPAVTMTGIMAAEEDQRSQRKENDVRKQACEKSTLLGSRCLGFSPSHALCQAPNSQHGLLGALGKPRKPEQSTSSTRNLQSTLFEEPATNTVESQSKGKRTRLQCKSASSLWSDPTISWKVSVSIQSDTSEVTD